MNGLSRSLALLVALAAVQTASGLLLVLAGALRGGEGAGMVPSWMRLVQLLAFGGSGAWLVLGAREDARPAKLGLVFLLIASSYAHAPLRGAADSHVALGQVTGLLASLRLDAFLGLSVWLFVRDFPRGLASRRVRALIRVGVRSSTAIGVALVSANFLIGVDLLRPEVAALLSPLDARRFDSAYWAISYGLTGAALPWVLIKASSAPLSERRRVRLFATALIAGAVPPALAVLGGGVSESFANVLRSAWGRGVLIPLLQIPIASIPVMTGYAVLVQQVMDVRLLVRSALRYALARSTLGFAVALPCVLLVGILYRSRHLPLAEVLVGGKALFTVAAALAALVALRLHASGLEFVDRMFYREHYDARLILLELTEGIRDARSLADLANRLTREVDRALHVDAIDLLLMDRSAGELRSALARTRSLSARSRLMLLVEESADAVDVNLERRREKLLRLPDIERRWLADTGFRRLVPVLTSSGELQGLICLGAKRSDLPFTREDTALLAAVAASGGRALESRLIRATTVADLTAPESGVGMECPACGAVQPTKDEGCHACGTPLVPSSLPRDLLGKFTLERRIGTGGMGVVFTAFDLVLRRRVAIKTLPRLSPEHALQLRREARTMAAVTHPHLALIFGADAWNGTPILILEYLGGGTLADRLTAGSLTVNEVVALGVSLASVLERLHLAGILHGDVKPSNVGYTEGGIPKLLDFGLSRMTASLVGPDADRRSVDSGTLDERSRTESVRPGFAGTPLYLSPEVILGEEPDAALDLWSTSVVLYEAIAGRHPFERPAWPDTFHAITRGHCPDIRGHAPQAPEALASFFREALALDRRKRPGSARELGTRLAALH